MITLTLHKRKVETIFNLLGTKENDLSYSLGWALAQCPPFLRATVKQFTGQEMPSEALSKTEVKLQNYDKKDRGYSDVEVIVPGRSHLIIEMKRGWVVPTIGQLSRYATRFAEEKQPVRRLFTLSECSQDYAEMVCPVASFKAAQLHHLTWAQLFQAMQNGRKACDHRQKRLLDEFKRYLMNTISQRKVDTNRVYVVALNDKKEPGWNLTYHDIVKDHSKYFHPVGHKYLKDPPTYIAFRYRGHLVSIHHVVSYVRTRNARALFAQKAGPGFPVDHFVYTLGKAIIPSKPVRTGRGIYRGGRVWCLLDTLLTCDTITEARDESAKRLASIGL